MTTVMYPNRVSWLSWAWLTRFLKNGCQLFYSRRKSGLGSFATKYMIPTVLGPMTFCLAVWYLAQ